MAQSRAETVDAWISEVDAARLPSIAAIRQLCLERLPGWQERMQWGMPGYGPAGQDAVVSFNNQKQHIALYAGEAALARFADRLAGADCGKGCLRFRRPEQIDFALLGEMLDDIRARGGTMA